MDWHESHLWLIVTQSRRSHLLLDSDCVFVFASLFNSFLTFLNHSLWFIYMFLITVIVWTSCACSMFRFPCLLNFCVRTIGSNTGIVVAYFVFCIPLWMKRFLETMPTLRSETVHFKEMFWEKNIIVWTMSKSQGLFLKTPAYHSY